MLHLSAAPVLKGPKLNKHRRATSVMQKSGSDLFQPLFFVSRGLSRPRYDKLNNFYEER